MEPATPFVHAAKATRKYLSQYAESEARLSAVITARCGRFGHGLTIPCYAEGEGIGSCLKTVPPGDRGPVLMVVVVNAPKEAAALIHEANARTLKKLRDDYGEPEVFSPTVCVYPHPAGSLLVIDRASQNFLPARQGVGLARKIGSDLLLALIEAERVASPWIHCSDADVSFPPDYFEQTSAYPGTGASALLYRFRHVSGKSRFEDNGPSSVDDPSLGSRLEPGDADRSYQAALKYEISLRYYVLGLRFAGSLHAFHSIGSTLAIHANAYAKVRGFPKREAAEDFYLLNKLAKVGPIERLEGDPLSLSSRTSSRVPFGTGAAVRRLVEGAGSQLLTYDPKIFHYLRVWHNALTRALDPQEPRSKLRERVRQFAEQDPLVEFPRLMNALTDTAALSSAETALADSGSGVSRRLFDGFDGFRTLKLVHALRGSGLRSVPLYDAIEQASFVSLRARADPKSAESIAREIETLEAQCAGPDAASDR